MNFGIAPLGAGCNNAKIYYGIDINLEYCIVLRTVTLGYVS